MDTMSIIWTILNLVLLAILFLYVKGAAKSLFSTIDKGEANKISWAVAIVATVLCFLFLSVGRTLSMIGFALIGVALVSFLHMKNRDGNADIKRIANTLTIASFLGLLQGASQGFQGWNFEPGKTVFQTIGSDLWMIVIPPAIGFVVGLVIYAGHHLTTAQPEIVEAEVEVTPSTAPSATPETPTTNSNNRAATTKGIPPAWLIAGLAIVVIIIFLIRGGGI
jgi:hypothetical protein